MYKTYTYWSANRASGLQGFRAAQNTNNEFSLKLKYMSALLGIVLMLLIFTNNSELRADNMDCTPDCPEDQFNYNCPPLTFTNGTCTVTVYWGYRIACGLFHDIIITALSYSSGCSFLTERDVLDFAAVQIMQSSFVTDQPPSGLGWELPNGPEEDSCKVNWRVNKWSCWRKSSGLTGSGSNLVACNNDPMAPCCLTWYKLCRDIYGNLVITIEDQYAPPTPCPTLPEWPSPCINVCD